MSVILWEGPSKIDGEPIVVIATRGSKNSKTGDMVQTWILRADVEPHEAIKSGADASICGACPHRGDGNGKGRTCYVLVHNAPLSIYRAYKRGSYTKLEALEVAQYGEGLAVRLGAYGDPLAVPLEVWESLTSKASKVTGYSHLWDTAGIDTVRAAGLVMASADSLDDAARAVAKGFRYFRTRDLGEAVAVTEIDCPASDTLTCADCGLCSGTKRANARSVSIELHGGSAVIANLRKQGRVIATS